MSSQRNSNVGFRSLYQSQDQRSHAQSEIEELTRQTGKNVKGFMPKDQAEKVNKLQTQEIERQAAEHMKNDPTFIAKMHGNSPSKGAMIDKELQEEDQAMLRKKGDSMTGKKM